MDEWVGGGGYSLPLFDRESPTDFHDLRLPRLIP